MTAYRFTRACTAVENALSRASESLTLARSITGALAEYITHDSLWRNKN
jgi:hypothetical protein